MGVGEAIQSARKKAGLTQEQLAAKVYVTRQAVSRWETGESEHGIDMRKLLASVLDAPIRELLDLPDAPACQCCGTPFDVPNMPFGTNADGTENPDYCGWCYQNGEFTSGGLDEIIEQADFISIHVPLLDSIREPPYIRQGLRKGLFDLDYFATNKDDAENILSEDWREDFCTALADGIIKYAP